MYDAANYVRKRKITSLVLSNITITPEKLVVFSTKPWLEGMLTTDNGDDGIRTHV